MWEKIEFGNTKKEFHRSRKNVVGHCPARKPWVIGWI